MGDIHKYLLLDLDLLVAIDNNKHNLANESKGALKRIFEQKSQLSKLTLMEII